MKITHFLVCSIHRSGSNYFRSLLRFLKLGEASELFRDEHYSTLESLKNDHIQKDVWSITCHRLFFRKLIDNVRHLSDIQSGTDTEILNQVFPGIRYIYLSRGNKVRRAISHVKASQPTGKGYNFGDRRFKDYCYNSEDIELRLKQHAIYESYWEDFFLDSNIRPLRIFYEDLVADPLSNLQRVINFLGIKRKIDVDKLEKFMNSSRIPQKQSDELSEEWVIRYLEESRCPGK